jgi:hypothetical protein
MWFLIPMAFPMAWTMLLLWPERWDDLWFAPEYLVVLEMNVESTQPSGLCSVAPMVFIYTYGLVFCGPSIGHSMTAHDDDAHHSMMLIRKAPASRLPHTRPFLPHRLYASLKRQSLLLKASLVHTIRPASIKGFALFAPEPCVAASYTQSQWA